MSKDQLRKFLIEMVNNKLLLKKVSSVGTAIEIVRIGKEFGYNFTVDELKSFSDNEIKGIRIKKQDTSPSYSFGESGN